jgi:hypothetical protein
MAVLEAEKTNHFKMCSGNCANSGGEVSSEGMVHSWGGGGGDDGDIAGVVGAEGDGDAASDGQVVRGGGHDWC